MAGPGHHRAARRRCGAVRIDFADSGTVIDSRVTAFEDGRLLAYSWSSGSEPERPMCWDLAPVDGGTRLTLTLRIPANEDAAKACAGFEGHLDMLAAALEGVLIKCRTPWRHVACEDRPDGKAGACFVLRLPATP